MHTKRLQSIYISSGRKGGSDMNEEKYVDSIVRKVKCSRKKRAEIRKEILSDVSVRIKNGEDWQQIRESMGTAEEIADEFNASLSKEEKKAYKTGKIIKILTVIVIALLLIGALVSWWLPKGYELGYSGYFTQEALEEKAEKIVLLLNQNDYEALKAESIEKMWQYLTRESIDEVRGLFGDDWGEMQSVGAIYAQELKQQGELLAITQFNVNYENVNVTYTLIFDKDMKLSGFYVR